MAKTECKATKHAYERAKQRFGWRAATLDRMMIKAFDEGMRHGELKGALNKYVNNLWISHKAANNIRIYGQNVYFFKGKLLITLYRINNKLVKYLKNCKK